MRFRFGHKNSCVYSVLPDDFGNLWLSTNRGLSRFTTPKKGLGGVFKNYDMENGLRSYEFGACLKCRDGSLLFWGINEFNIIKPDQVRDNPEIVIRPPHEKLTNRESEICLYCARAKVTM